VIVSVREHSSAVGDADEFDDVTSARCHA